MPVIVIPTTLISFDVFTVSCFDFEADATVNPVITIDAMLAVAISGEPLFVKINGAETVELPARVKPLPLKTGVPENNPDGNLIVTVSAAAPPDAAANPRGTVKLIVSVPTPD